MKISYHKQFLKQFHKLPKKIQNKFFERIALFQHQPFHPLLNNHSIDPTYPAWRSINITGNYRALFEPSRNDIMVFMKIGTYSELY